MEYCPFCAEKVPVESKTCPNCKKAIDLNQIENLYIDDTVEINKNAARGIWFRENSRFIFPFIFLVIGLVAGGAFAYSYSLLSFASQKSDYEKQIQNLQKAIDDNSSQTSQDLASRQKEIARKDEIIIILKNQRRFMSQIINFTRRLAENSNITTADPGQLDYYNRNVLYLISQYNLEKEKMLQLDSGDKESFNLRTIPQLFAE